MSSSPAPPSSPATARLFVAVWPSSPVVAAVAALARPSRPSVRWTTPDQWHVTLRFLGTAPVDVAVDALSRVAGAPGCEAVVGRRPIGLGREVLALPVEGLADLAAAVDTAFAGIGRAPGQREFRGHLTLARGKDVRSARVGDLDAPLRWPVGSVSLVRSHLGRSGARYETIAAVDLTRPVG